jgi:phage-related protein
MKDITFCADSLARLRDFPDDARQDAGYQLHKVQSGLQPDDFKPLPTVGQGVEEIRTWSEEGTFRVVYIAKLESGVYVLHAFQKKTEGPATQHLRIARQCYQKLKLELDKAKAAHRKAERRAGRKDKP